ncbi:polynucleotide adenylyltransferase PcnB [Corallincola luteus]|uniref:Poly(A) polymerase I n=2 Tax=Corallincola TaxID=1775176 RepID=A0A368NN74_9GAMM|nr:polynucleotide adenylyltransferase PcnB [Corallincola holothuriorum]TCI04763.1 polynucleotide adenylyltransferase PcnB [Corallincola luteus]
MCKQAVGSQAGDKSGEKLSATVIPRSAHSISRTDISDNALKVLYRLNKNGYQAYLVGGGVRDLLLGLKPKDFDIVTDASPEQVKKLFRNCRLVGRRFRLAHILFGRDIIEVATMRGHHSNAEDDTVGTAHAETGMILRDNVYGTIEEDAERRDFSINALYYDISDFSVHDFADGIKAIKKRQIELIGDPETRYREDPVRMLRAVRFAVKLDMSITPRSAAPIKELANMLAQIPAARLFEEIQKLFLSGKALATYKMLREYKLMQQLFPALKSCFTKEGDSDAELFLEAALANTDRRIAEGKRVTPAFLFAALYWGPVQRRCDELMLESDLPYVDALGLASSDVLDSSQKRIALPKRFSVPAREIWQLQLRLPKRMGSRAAKLAGHPRFRAAYDFLLLRGQIAGGEVAQLGQWWTDYQSSDEGQQQKLVKELKSRGPRRRNTRRRRKPAEPKQ